MSRTARWVAGVCTLVVLLLIIGMVLVIRDLRSAETQVLKARSLLRRVATANAVQSHEARVKSQGRVDEALGQIDAAEHTLRTSTVLSMTKSLPVLRGQRAGALRLVADARAGTLSARQLLTSVDTLGDKAKVVGGAVPLDRLSELETAVRRAGEEIRPLARGSDGLWSSLREGRDLFDAQAVQMSDRLLDAADGLRAARSFLGVSGPRRYFVALENNAEMRDQGMVLSFAVLDANAGRLTFVRSGSVKEIPLHGPVPTPMAAGTAEVFGSIGPTTRWQSVNATADFPWSAGAMQDMYRQVSGDQVGGVIAMDVPALAGLLKVTGPVQVPGLPRALSAGNAVGQLLHDIYQYPPTDAAASKREDQINGATLKALIDRLTRGSFDPVALGQELGKAAAGGHLRLWSQVPAEEAELNKVGLGGGPASEDGDRTFHFAVESRAPTKLDYYVEPSVRQSIRLEANGDAVVRTTISIDNKAPVGSPPSVQLGPNGSSTERPGDYSAWALLWGPSGSIQDASVGESALQLTQSVLFVPAGKRQDTAVVETRIPHAVRDGRLELRYVPQARLEAIPLAVTLEAPGWDVAGNPSRRVTLDRVQRLTWGVTR